MRQRVGFWIMGAGVWLMDAGCRLLDVGAGLVRVQPPAGMAERIMRRLTTEGNKRPKAADDWLLNPRNWGDYV